MQVEKLPIFLLFSSVLIFSTVHSEPNHNHDHNNEDYTSETTVEILNSGTTPGHETPTVAQNDTRLIVTSSKSDGTFSSNSDGTSSSNRKGPDAAFIVFYIGILILSILLFTCFLYHLCKRRCACGRDETPVGVIMQQSTTVQPHQQPPAPQIILQQPIIYPEAPPDYLASQRWTQPPPQDPQWTPHPMGQQQHYSPISSYDNAGYIPAAAPPPYNTGKY